MIEMCREINRIELSNLLLMREVTLYSLKILGLHETKVSKACVVKEKRSA